MTLKTLLPVAAFAAMTLFTVSAAEPDPKVMSYTLLKNVKWVESDLGALTSVISGDPSKPGMYVMLVKWTAGHMSRPHFHPNDRFITVVSGTWWCGWGPKFDKNTTFPMPAGTTVVHYGKQIHYDGAKDGDVILQMVGMGPATATDAEQK